MYKAKAYSAASATSPLARTAITRRDPTERDVQIEILFSGICHSDLHSVRNEWSEFSATTYPIVPGHEMVGRVTKVGAAVTKYQPGEGAAALLLGTESAAVNVKSVKLGAEPTRMLQCSGKPPDDLVLNPSGGLLRIVREVKRLQNEPRGDVEAVIETRSLGGAWARVILGSA